uniref:Reverse transcriptase domain-containing protein n=1 Tax=Triticum urartu TaxID=4572 RepID=A0A8R7Q748_TRIUA
MEQLHTGGFNSFEILNESILTLLPKKEGALHLRDFRPINLIHGAAKIFAKVLVVRLSPLLPKIITQAQCAFVNSRSIHENFKFVRSAARQLHQRKTKAILMKIDISKAFDTLSWEFLLEVLRRRGFGERWISWICGLLRTASTSILLNGVLGEPFMLGSGVRQGDPISPALFIIAMDTLHALMEWAKQHRLLSGIWLG